MEYTPQEGDIWQQYDSEDRYFRNGELIAIFRNGKCIYLKK